MKIVIGCMTILLLGAGSCSKHVIWGIKNNQSGMHRISKEVKSDLKDNI